MKHVHAELMDEMDHADRLYRYAVSADSTRADHLASAAGYIEELEAKIERLTSRGIEDMKFTISELETEDELLRKDRERLEWIVFEVGEYNRPVFPLLAGTNWRDAIDQAIGSDTPNVSCDTASIAEGE